MVDARTRVLVLGSLPGEQSLAAARYYAHQRNQFWHLAGAVIGRDLVRLDYPERLQALLEGGIGLWDVVASASRRGSLDASIRDHEANDLAALAGSLPQLAAIGFNGGKAASIGSDLLAGLTRLALLSLPSSSPAYTLPVDAKRVAWMGLRAYL